MEKGLNSYIKEQFDQKEIDERMYSPLVLAYLGDCAYELVIRTYNVGKGATSVSRISKMTNSYAKAPTQAKMIDAIYDLLTEEEQAVYRRGRNAKSHTSAKNANIVEYRKATGFEAMLGVLYLQDSMERIVELVKIGFEKLELVE